MNRTSAAHCVVLLALALGCQGPAEPETRWVSLRPSLDIEAAPAALEARPPVLLRVVRVGSELAVQLPRDAPTVTLSLPGACPVTVEPGDSKGRTIDVQPWLRFPPPVAQAGYGKTTTVTVVPGCEAAAQTSVGWSVLRGAPKAPLEPGPNGHSVTVVLPELAIEPRPWGIVPISAAERGEVVLAATFVDGLGQRHTRRVSVAAAARATGLPSVTAGQSLLLGGHGWRIAARPSDGRGEIASQRGSSWFTPETAGGWTLEDEEGRALRVTAGNFSTMPLDCTRGDCHGHLAETKPSKMRTVFQRGLTGVFGRDYDPYCALQCHTTGEPGLEHGGFFSALAAGHTPLHSGPRAWEDLHRPLRRLGGVGCLACHGPAAIPPESARWSILRSDVCATCHDLPPEYGHSAAWASTAMSRADARPETRDVDRGCAMCHTTSGFLVATKLSDELRPVPPVIGSIGLGCVTCHDPHGEDAKRDGAHSMLRDVPVPGWLESSEATTALADPRARVCVFCHAPTPDTLDASASAAAVWAGRGGLDPKTGHALLGSAPHGGVAGGCVGCHHDGPVGLRRGASHALRVSNGACKRCHEDKPIDASIRQRALALLERTNAAPDAAMPPHARHAADAPDAVRARALYDLRLVVEDPAAAVHNPGYARGLVAAAEAVLGTGAP